MQALATPRQPPQHERAPPLSLRNAAGRVTPLPDLDVVELGRQGLSAAVSRRRACPARPSDFTKSTVRRAARREPGPIRRRAVTLQGRSPACSRAAPALRRHGNVGDYRRERGHRSAPAVYYVTAGGRPTRTRRSRSSRRPSRICRRRCARSRGSGRRSISTR